MKTISGVLKWTILPMVTLATVASLSQVRARSLDPRSIKTLHTLEPLMSERAKKFLLLIKRRHPLLDARAIMGTRTYQEQDALYAIGRTLPGRPVTNARGGQSNHNFNIAFDLGIFSLGVYQPASEWYAKLGDLADEAELGWGGNWKSRLVDRPHYQWPTDLSMAELRRLKENNQLISEQPQARLSSSEERALRFQDSDPELRLQSLKTKVQGFVRFVENPSEASTSDIRSFLPKSILLSDPEPSEDDQAVGLVSSMTGLIHGILVFTSSDSDGVGSSHLSQIQIYLGDSIKANLESLGTEIRRLLSKKVHLEEAERPTKEAVRENLPNVSGYRVSWKFKSGRRLDLWQHWYGHKWVLCFYLDPVDLPAIAK